VNEVTVKNFRQDHRFGWGYSCTPTGSGTQIAHPAFPDHTGTLHQIEHAKRKDRTFQSVLSGGVYKQTAYFYQGRRIVATWRWGLINPAPDLPEALDSEAGHRANERHHQDNDGYGYGWFDGFDYSLADDDLKLRLE
jgi:hypothetical protein